MTWPVTKSDAADSRYSTIPTKSSGSPSRCSEMRAILRSRDARPASVSENIQLVRADRKTAGAMAFTLIPRGPPSVASVLVSESVAAADRGDEHQLAPAVPRGQVPAERLGHQPRPAHVGVHDRLPVLVWHVLDRGWLVVAGGDQHRVHDAIRGDRRRQDVLGVGLRVGAAGQG